GLLTAPAGLRPWRVRPAEVRAVAGHPGVLRGAEGLDAAAQVDGEAPAVVAGAGNGGERGFQAVEVHLGLEGAVGVGDAQRAAERAPEGLVHGLEGRGRVAAQHVVGDADAAERGEWDEAVGVAAPGAGRLTGRAGWQLDAAAAPGQAVVGALRDGAGCRGRKCGAGE